MFLLGCPPFFFRTFVGHFSSTRSPSKVDGAGRKKWRHCGIAKGGGSGLGRGGGEKGSTTKHVITVHIWSLTASLPLKNDGWKMTFRNQGWLRISGFKLWGCNKNLVQVKVSKQDVLF